MRITIVIGSEGSNGGMTGQLTHVERQAAEHLATRRIRFTPGRQAVFRTLARADGPMSAAEIDDRLAEVPLSSIYRTLSVLEEAGLLAPHHARGVTRYEVADWIAGHHHHVLCTECGAVEDVVLPVDLEAALEGVVGAVAATTGFDHDGHALEIEGRCAACR
jgi:Fur family transcriptional regulator, ferric uptake regulator